MRPSPITPDPGQGDRGGRLFGAVFIPTGQGGCARPGGSAYPHYCSLLTRVDSAEAHRLVARDSASARMSVLQLMRACGITAPPRRGEFIFCASLLRGVFIAGCGSHRRSAQDRPAGTRSFRIWGRFARSAESAIGTPVAALAAQPTTCPSSSPPYRPSLKVVSYAVVYSPVPSTLIRASILCAWPRSRAAQYRASPSCPGSLLAICSYTFTECW